MENQDTNLGEEPDDDFFENFFDEDALETIGRVWNNSQDELSNHCSPDDLVQVETGEHERCVTKPTDSNPTEKNELSDNGNVSKLKNLEIITDPSLKAPKSLHEGISCSLINSQCVQKADQNKDTCTATDGELAHVSAELEGGNHNNTSGENSIEAPLLQPVIRRERMNEEVMTHDHQQSGELCADDMKEGRLSVNTGQKCKIQLNLKPRSPPQLKHSSVSHAEDVDLKMWMSEKASACTSNVQMLVDEDVQSSAGTSSLLICGAPKCPVQDEIAKSCNAVPSDSHVNHTISRQVKDQPLGEISTSTHSSDSLVEECAITTFSKVNHDLLPNETEKDLPKHKKKKKKKRQKCSRSRSPSPKKVKTSDKLNSVIFSREKSPKKNKWVRKTLPMATERLKFSPTKRKAIVRRSRSRSISPVLPKKSSNLQSTYKPCRSWRSSRSRSKSLSRSPTRRHRRRVTRSPRRSRSRSPSRFAGHRRPSRTLRSSPYRSRSPSNTKSHLSRSRSRSRSPFINEIYRLKRKWAEEDKARKAVTQPPPPGSSVGDTVCGFLPKLSTWNNNATEMVSDMLSVSVESVQVHSTSFSVNNVFSPLISTPYVDSAPVLNYTSNIPMACAPTRQADFFPQANENQHCFPNHGPPPQLGPPICFIQPPFQSPASNSLPQLPVFGMTPPPFPLTSIVPHPSSEKEPNAVHKHSDLLTPALKRQLSILKSSVVSPQNKTATAPKQHSLQANGTFLSSDRVSSVPKDSHESGIQALNSPCNETTTLCEMDQSKQSRISVTSNSVAVSPSEIYMEVSEVEKTASVSPENRKSIGEEMLIISQNEHHEKDTEDYDSDIIIEEIPEKPAPELICLSEDDGGSDDDETEIYDVVTELNKIQKDSHDFQRLKKKQAKQAKVKRKKEKKFKKASSLTDNVVNNVLKDCYEVIDSLRVGRFIVSGDETSKENIRKPPNGSNSVLWEGSCRTQFSFTQAIPPEEMPSKREMCTNTPSVLSLDVSTSTENVCEDVSVQTETNPCPNCCKQNILVSKNIELQAQVEHLKRERDTLLLLIKSRSDDSPPNFQNVERLHASQVPAVATIDEIAAVSATEILSQNSYVPRNIVQSPVLSYEYHHSSSIPTSIPHAGVEQ